MYTVYIGDNNTELGEEAKRLDNAAYLLNSSNFLDDIAPFAVVYTSLADMPKDLSILYNILLNAKEVVYYPPASWSDNKQINPLNPSNSMQGLTECILLSISNKVNVVNLGLCIENKYTDQKPHIRKSNTPHLWIAGDSVSYGIGVKPDECYGSLLSNRLDLPSIMLAQPGTSIQWSAGEILKADLMSGDTVVWGLSIYSRLPFYNNSSLKHISSADYKIHPDLRYILPIDLLDSEDTLYHSVNTIQQVINICQKLNIKLIMFDALVDPVLNRVVTKFTEYHQLIRPVDGDHQLFTEIDFGNDQLHPGPLSHKFYADCIEELITT